MSHSPTKQGQKIGRIRLKVIPDCSANTLLPFISANIEPGSDVSTDGWKGYEPLDENTYRHHKVFQNKKGNGSLLEEQIQEIDKGREDKRVIYQISNSNAPMKMLT